MSADHHETILLKSTNWDWLTTLISTPAQYTQDSWRNQSAEMGDEESESVSGATSFGAVIYAHRFIAKSRKTLKKEEEDLLNQADGAKRGQNLRQAIFDQDKQNEANMNMNKSRNWDMLKKTITSAKITDALTALKFVVNGKKYTALRPLGQGGYSQVFEVYNPQKDLFALKVVNLGEQSEKMKNDLIREILFLEKLKNCNNVVRAFEYQIKENEDEYKMFVLMEKGDRDLFQILNRLKETKALSPSRLRFYWEQMLTAMLEVHSANIIHADIKPGNFLLVAGELKIIDFGMACEIPTGQDYVVRNFISGTKEYMSPEAYAGMLRDEDDSEEEVEKEQEISIKITKKVDVWALGIILYQIIYGFQPFHQVPGGRMSKIRAVSSLLHPVEFDEKENLDPELLDTMKRCLEKDPTKRATIEELLMHPYLRPQHQKVSNSKMCNNCKTWQRDMAKVNHKRGKKVTAHIL